MNARRLSQLRVDRFIIVFVLGCSMTPTLGAASFNVAPDGSAFMGKADGTTGAGDVPLVHFGPANEINDEVVITDPALLVPNGYQINLDPDGPTGPQSNGADSFNTEQDLDFVGVYFPTAVSGISSVRFQNFLANDGGWWGSDETVSGGVPLSAADITSPQVQVTTNLGANWTDVATVTSDYVDQYTGVIRGSGFPLTTRGPMATITFAMQNNINGIRLIGDGAGAAGGPGFVAITELEVLQEMGVVFPTLNIETNTGEITLNTGSGGAREIQGYTIRSSAGALDPSAWTSVANNYDMENAGPNQVDSDDPWTELSALSTNLSESELSGGNGGQLGPSLALSLGNVWDQNPFDGDISAEILLPDGRVRRVAVTYNGQDSNPLEMGDFNFDGLLSALDWPMVRDNYNADLSGLTTIQQYGRGDLTGDGLNNEFDFSEFKALFEAANGSGSFAAMLTSVPEPSGLAMIGVSLLIVNLGARLRLSNL